MRWGAEHRPTLASVSCCSRLYMVNRAVTLALMPTVPSYEAYASPPPADHLVGAERLRRDGQRSQSAPDQERPSTHVEASPGYASST
jgi:hypothetical protein